MGKRFLIYGGVAAVLLALAFGATIFGVEKERTITVKEHERILHKTQERLRVAEQRSTSLEERLRTAKRTRKVRRPFLLPDGTIAMANGLPLFETVETTEEELDRSLKATEEAIRLLSRDRDSATDTTRARELRDHQISKPAVKKMALLYGYEFFGARHWAGAGFRQNLWILEIEVGAMFPMLPVPSFKGMGLLEIHL